MPIDPKKFKKIVTNHFANLSEEEFLKTLHKSSPYIFDGSSEAKHDITLSDRDEIASLNIITKLSPISDPEFDRAFLAELEEEANRMKSNNIDIITIRGYIIKQKLMYIFAVVVMSIKYLTRKITKTITKKA
jgi:hypothetical protein